LNHYPNIILAGDDQQLPPIIHGSYPEEHEHMISSVFAFMRRQIEQASVDDPSIETRKIFQLEENFRMNESLTAYPRHILYRGCFKSTRPAIKIETTPAIDETSEEINSYYPASRATRSALLVHAAAQFHRAQSY
jgi:superfamily I DNA and/or RNA helicase